MVIYADVLLVTNLYVNFALLDCSSHIMRRPASRLRMLLGAAVGSVYCLVIFLPEIPKLVELFSRLAVTVLIVFCTFGYGDIKKYSRSFFTFLAVSMGFGGIMLVLWLTVAPVGMMYNNGAVYFDISLPVLAFSTVVCFTVVSLVSHIIERKAPRESIAFVTVYLNGKSVRLKALIDTGNSLRESFSGYPVVVAEYGCVKSILPTAIDEYIKGNQNFENSENFRLIINTTVNGTGIMPSFKPDLAEIETVNRKIRTDKLYIAVIQNNIADGEFEMILNPSVLEGENDYEAVRKN